MKLRVVILSLIAGITGCSAPDFHAEHYANRFKQYGYGYTPEQTESSDESDSSLHGKILKKYADRIAYEIALQVDQASFPLIAVASFVDLDDSLANTHPLGNKLAEDLQLSMQEEGFRVADLQVAKNLNMTPQGNFIFKRHTEHTVRLPFILSGIINYTPNGANVNVRLVATQSGAILAAYTLTIPNFVIENAFPHIEGQDIVIKGS